MLTRYRPISLGLFSVFVIACAVSFSRSDHTDRVSAETLQAAPPLQWYRGNMHTHSHWSDGDDYLEMIAQWYRDRDYNFLCFTDHNILANHERWIDVEKSKGSHKAFDKLKAKFADGWTEERMQEGRLQVRLKRFDEVSDKLAVPGK